MSEGKSSSSSSSGGESWGVAIAAIIVMSVLFGDGCIVHRKSNFEHYLDAAFDYKVEENR